MPGSRTDQDTIRAVRAYTLAGAGADYHDQSPDHWIVGQIATPMSRYPAYRATRTSWGINVLGTVVVEVEAGNGTIGVGVSTGGVPACWIIERHLSRFLLGQHPSHVERLWDQMYRASIYYGRKGLALNALSAVDLALWDLWGKLRREPVYSLIGGAVRDTLSCYATGPRPDRAHELGFIGGKIPLVYGPADGEEGLKANVAQIAAWREKVGPDFWLMVDCWMALDLPYARRLANALSPYDVRWLEECFLPDDYWSYQEFRTQLPPGVMLTGGEHEAGRLGFRMLLDMGCVDLIQPDVGWCGGLTELLKIAALADAYNVWTVPHGSSVYSYHFALTRPNSPFSEFLMMHPQATEVVPMFQPLLLGEPVPENGRIRLSDAAGFGVEINRQLALERPFPC